MATKIPLRATFDNGNNPTGIAEFQTNEFVPVSHGGTGLGSYIANQILIGNSANNLAVKTLTAGSGIIITDGGTTLELSSTAVIPIASTTTIGGITVQTSATSGLTLGVGEIDSNVTNQNGSGYGDNDRLKINSGNKDAILQPATISGGLILTANLIHVGTGYSPTGTNVTTFTAGSISEVTLNAVGTGYTTATNVATTGIYGTGLTVDITAVAGEITTATVNTGGSDYYVDDVIIVSGGNTDANLIVSTVVGGIFVSGDMVSGGTGYSTATNVSTTGGNGTGLTVNTTVDGGSVINVAVNYGGSGYQVNDIITVSGGNTDATVKITNIKGSGSGYTLDITAVKVGDLVHSKKTDSSIQIGPGSGNNDAISYINIDKYGHIQGTIETKTITIDVQADAVAMAIALGG